MADEICLVESEGDISSTITAVLTGVNPVEAVGDIFSIAEFTRVMPVESSCDIVSTIYLNVPCAVAAESVADTPVNTISVSMPTGIVESETELIAAGAIGYMVDSVMESVCEMVALGEVGYLVEGVVASDGDISSAVLSSYYNALPVESNADVLSVCAKVFSVVNAVESAGDISAIATANYFPLSVAEQESLIQSSILTASISVGLVDSESQLPVKHLSASILNSTVEAVSEITSQYPVVASYMLALVGMSAQASLFSNFNFDSFIEGADGSIYASGPDGIYRLFDATTDNGVDIVPEVPCFQIDYRCTLLSHYRHQFL